MGDAFRIRDRFKVTGRGIIYTIERNGDVQISVGHILMDLRGNRFKVISIELLGRISEGRNIEDLPVGLLFELLDGVGASGNILVRDVQNINFLFCMSSSC